jgi:hypothetical protein
MSARVKHCAFGSFPQGVRGQTGLQHFHAPFVRRQSAEFTDRKEGFVFLLEMNMEPRFGDKANVAVLPKVQAFELDFLRQRLEKRAEAFNSRFAHWPISRSTVFADPAF